MKMKLSEELAWRGFVNQTTYKDVSRINESPINFYFGVDPSAPSMTIGNLAAVMMVYHFMKYGHKAHLLVGGATGLIGDPDGKAEERKLKTEEEVASFKKAIIGQYESILRDYEFTVVDNYDWFKNIGYLEFLRDIGKHVPMRQMLGRDFVQARLNEGGAGISYAEFSYVLIQAYDFLYLNKHHGVTLQLCGSDQWGNSIAGVDLIRRKTGNEAHVWSTPLVINKSTGKKFGKSEGGAIWLDSELTSVFDFYQFWLNVDDEGVEDYLKIYTLLDKEAIDNTMLAFNENRSKRIAQQTLAYEVTKIVHGHDAADSAKAATSHLYGERDYTSFNAQAFESLNLPVFTIEDGATLFEAFTNSGIAKSNSEVRRLLSEGGLYINDKKVDIHKEKLEEADFIDGYLILRRGKNTQVLIKNK